jgi:hypothetical protein
VRAGFARALVHIGAHDAACLADTLRAFEIAVDATLQAGKATHKVPA